MSHITYMQMIKKNYLELEANIPDLANCLEAIQMWMGNNKLKLNPKNTELIMIGNDWIRNSLKLSFPLSLFDDIMEQVESIKTLVSPWILTTQ